MVVGPLLVSLFGGIGDQPDLGIALGLRGTWPWNSPRFRNRTYGRRLCLDFDGLVRRMGRGFIVTELMGQGINTVTGDYSRGAAGLWIRNGELAFAVSEVTIAGNLTEMLLGLEAIGSDLEFRGSVAAPTLKIGEMTVGGK